MFCPSCGEPANDSAISCAACRTPLIPLARYEVLAKEDVFKHGYRIARLGDRLLAHIMDGALILMLYTVLGAVPAFAQSESGALWFFDKVNWTAALLALVFALLYFVLAEALWGRTIGKALIGLEVRMTGGQPAAFKASLVRNTARLIDAAPFYLLGLASALVSRENKRLGDCLAGTMVVDSRLRRISRVGTLLLWLSLMAGGVWVNLSVMGVNSLPSMAVLERRLAVSHFKLLEPGSGSQRRAEKPYGRGDMLNFEYTVSGFIADKQREMDLKLEVEVLDPEGVALMQKWEEKINSLPPGRSRNIKRFFSLQIPPFAPNGAYQINVRAIDALSGNASASRSAGFMVQGEMAAPALSLEVRAYKSGISKDLLSEEAPLMQPPGTLYIVFELFGLGLRNGQCDVRVHLKLHTPEGGEALDIPQWITVREDFFYHPPGFFLPLNGYLDIPAALKPGLYTLRLNVLDNVNQISVSYDSKIELR